MIAHLRRWTTTHRRTVSLLAAAVAVAAFSIGSTSVAQAQPVTCSNSDTVELDDGYASATVTAHRNCWDGTSRYEIVVRDIVCDYRAAHLQLDFYNPDSVLNTFGNADAYRTEVVSASNGCGTETGTVAFTSTNPNPDLLACVNAKNSHPMSGLGLVSDCASF